MKNIGFFGVAEATTLIGEVRLAPSVGFETVKGKSSEPVESGGSCWFWSGGAGRGLVLGDHVIGNGGVVG
jgi:hypothetical protein